MRKALAIFPFLLVFPRVSDAEPNPVASKAALTTACSIPSGWADIAQRKPHFVVFGEIHGTEEAPELVGNVACALAAQGKSILVAVEHNVSFDAAYQAAWQLPPEKFAAALLKEGWNESTDGKGSVAMLTMTKHLHQLAWQGRAIRIAAFDGNRDDEQRRQFSTLPGQGPREAAQADNIRIAANAGSYDLVLVLTGNIHARKLPFERTGTAVEPMAMHLARTGPMVTLDARYSGGGAWTCQLKPGLKLQPGKALSTDAIECAVHDFGLQPDLGPVPFVSLAASSDAAKAYDGFFWLGTAHGSPPAVQAHLAR